MLGRIVGTGIGLALGAGAGYGIYTMASGVTDSCYMANYHPEPTPPEDSTVDQRLATHDRNSAQSSVVSGQCHNQHPIASAIGNVDPYVTLGGLALVGGILGWIVAGKL